LQSQQKGIIAKVNLNFQQFKIMDRNTIYGLLIIFAILIGASFFNRPSKDEIETAKRRNDSLALVRAEQEMERQAAEVAIMKQREVADSEKNLQDEARLGSFAQASKGDQEFIVLENDLMRVKISTLGGRIYSDNLKGFKSYSGDSLILFSGSQNVFGLQFWGNNNNIETQNLFFSPSITDSLVKISKGDDPYTLKLMLGAGDNSAIDYIYTIHPESYMIDFKIHFRGMDNVITKGVGSIDLIWDFTLPQLEKGAKNESDNTTISYRYPNGDYEEISPRSDKEEKNVSTKLQWIGYKQQFFSTFLVAEEHFLNADMKSIKIADGTYTKQFSSRFSLPFENGKDESLGFKFYFGPNHFNTLESYDYGFENVVPLGSWIIKWINRYVVIFVFDLLDNHIASYGLIILLLTIIIKVVLFPLTYKSYVSQAKMRVLKPQIEELNAKYPKKDEAVNKQQAVMALYKKVGVNPLGGCLPMLIQFPILIAMFRFFPASFELRQKSFLWADDLSSYDSILSLPFEIPMYGDHISLFTLLMAVAMYITSKSSAEQMGDPNAQMPGMKFMMLYMMPLMLLVWFNNYSAGLSYYYFLSNVMTIGQTYLIRQTVDDKAILKKLNENAKKPTKKSKFQEKLEQMSHFQKNAKKGKK